MPGVFLAVGLVVGISAPRPFGNGIKLDDNTKQVLTTLLTGLTGLAGGLVVAFIGFSREDQHRFTADKAAAYSRLLGAGDLARLEIYAVESTDSAEEKKEAENRYDAVMAAATVAGLLGTPEVVNAINNYTSAITSFYNFNVGAEDTNGNVEVSKPAGKADQAGADNPLETHNGQVVSTRNKLMQAMRVDLQGRRGLLG
ncbi:MAG: hypothetical protein ACLQHS_13060 [Candidatus Limnocylindrales bacterium]